MPILTGHARDLVASPTGGLVGSSSNVLLVLATIALVALMKALDRRQQQSAAKLQL